MKSEIDFQIKNLNIHYGTKQALFDIAMDIPKNQVTALISSSGCGKSTLYDEVKDRLKEVATSLSGVQQQKQKS